VNRHRLPLVGIGLLGLLSAGCSSPCEESLGVYPPDHIVVTGMEMVDVPHIAWECRGFHSDSMDPPPSVSPDARGQVRVEVPIEEDSSIEVTLGNEQVALDPAPATGANSWMIRVADPSEPLIVRLCSAEDACAMYWANLYSG